MNLGSDVVTAGFKPAIVQVASEVTLAISVATEVACLHRTTTDPAGILKSFKLQASSLTRPEG